MSVDSVHRDEVGEEYVGGPVVDEVDDIDEALGGPSKVVPHTFTTPASADDAHSRIHVMRPRR